MSFTIHDRTHPMTTGGRRRWGFPRPKGGIMGEGKRDLYNTNHPFAYHPPLRNHRCSEHLRGFTDPELIPRLDKRAHRLISLSSRAKILKGSSRGAIISTQVILSSVASEIARMCVMLYERVVFVMEAE